MFRHQCIAKLLTVGITIAAGTVIARILIEAGIVLAAGMLIATGIGSHSSMDNQNKDQQSKQEGLAVITAVTDNSHEVRQQEGSSNCIIYVHHFLKLIFATLTVFT